MKNELNEELKMMNEEFARSVKNSLHGFFILREALFFIFQRACAPTSVGCIPVPPRRLRPGAWVSPRAGACAWSRGR